MGVYGGTITQKKYKELPKHFSAVPTGSTDLPKRVHKGKSRLKLLFFCFQKGVAAISGPQTKYLHNTICVMITSTPCMQYYLKAMCAMLTSTSCMWRLHRHSTSLSSGRDLKHRKVNSLTFDTRKQSQEEAWVSGTRLYATSLFKHFMFF